MPELERLRTRIYIDGYNFYYAVCEALLTNGWI